jgi:hypothetical protein
LITPDDDFGHGPDLDPDDPLTVILRPTPGHLVPPPGRYEEIRRGASRRRLLRTAAGAGVTCAVAALAVLVPLRLTAHEAPARPTVPLAPPPVSSPSTLPADPPASDAPPSRLPTKESAVPTPGPRTSAPTGTAVPGATDSRTVSPTPSEPTAAPDGPSLAPSASSTGR